MPHAAHPPDGGEHAPDSAQQQPPSSNTPPQAADAVGALWDTTQGLRAMAGEDAVRRLWEQHERRAAARHPAPQTPVFVLPPGAAIDDILVDNVITRSIVPSRTLTQETADTLRRRLEDTRHNPAFKTAGVIFARCVAQANGYRGVNYFYIPHHTDFPPETQRRFSIIHSDERRVLEAVTYFTQTRQDGESIPRASRAIFGVDSALLQSERNFDVLMQALDATPEPPVLFVFEGATPLPGIVRQRTAHRSAWAFWDTLQCTLRVVDCLREMKREPLPTKQLMLMQEIEAAVRAAIRLTLESARADGAPARFVQRIPFALCGAQCLLVVGGSQQDEAIAALSPAYAAWRAHPPADAPEQQHGAHPPADAPEQQHGAPEQQHGAHPPADAPEQQHGAPEQQHGAPEQQHGAPEEAPGQREAAGLPPARYVVWEAPADLVSTLPLFPLAVCLLQDAGPSTLGAALDELYTRKRWSVAIYPLQGPGVTPFAAVRFVRHVVEYITRTSGASFAPDDTRAGGADRRGMLGAVRDTVLNRTHRLPYTAAYAAARAPTVMPSTLARRARAPRPHFLLCDEEPSESWLAAAGVKEPPFLDDFLARAFFTLDAVYAIMTEFAARA